MIIILSCIIISALPFDLVYHHPTRRKQFSKIVKTIYLDIKENSSEVFLIAMFFTLLIVFFVINIFAPFHPINDDYRTGQTANNPPGGKHVLGTNWAAQDIFSRVLFALQKLAIAGLFGAFGYLVGFFLFVALPRHHQKCSYFLRIVFMTGLFTYIFPLSLVLKVVSDTSSSTLDLFIPEMIALIPFILIPGGFLMSNRQLGKDISSRPSDQVRPILGVGALLSIILFEFSRMISTTFSSEYVSFGDEIRMSGLVVAMINYPWILLSPLFVLSIAMVLLLIFTFYPSKSRVFD